MKASKEEVLAKLRAIGEGKEPWQPMRAHLLILGQMAPQIEAQMGVDGRASFADLVACWRRMAADGDSDGKKVLDAIAAHPTMGPKLRAIIGE
jgi:hypothetical protein